MRMIIRLESILISVYYLHRHTQSYILLTYPLLRGSIWFIFRYFMFSFFFTVYLSLILFRFIRLLWCIFYFDYFLLLKSMGRPAGRYVRPAIAPYTHIKRLRNFILFCLILFYPSIHSIFISILIWYSELRNLGKYKTIIIAAYIVRKYACLCIKSDYLMQKTS